MGVVFGVSTHLYVGERLGRDHLVEIAAHGFEAVELFAARSHFDYTDRRLMVALAEWLDDTRLRLTSCHAPIAAAYEKGTWRGGLSVASSDEAKRKQAVDETLAVLGVASVVPYRCLVLHAGVPNPYAAAADNHRAALARSLAELVPAAAAVGVTVALEVIPNELSTASTLAAFIEADDELRGVGMCLDVGHARLIGDAVDAIENASGHIVTTHLHDNWGKSDDHLVPGEGVIDWDAALMAFQKVGYDGPWMFEPQVSSTPRSTLERLVKARARFESLLKIGDEMLE